MTVDAFIERYQETEASERGAAQMFLGDLCAVLDVPRPDPPRAETRKNQYVFERRVDYPDQADRERGFIDLYKRGCFVLEAKQGSDAPSETEGERLGVEEPTRRYGTARRDRREWERAMQRAKNQAYRYARGLPDEEGWPPFLVAVDVGHCIDLHADFARQGKNYVPFPDANAHRIFLEDLRDEAVRERLRAVFADPLSLDPTRRSTAVTRQLAEHLAQVAASLEEDHDPDRVAGFLMRCLFTMFAEDVELLPPRSFTELLERCRGTLGAVPKILDSLWATMDAGGFDAALMEDVREFNGSLFEDHDALPVSEAQLELLIKAAEADWSDVEPAIFGTLLERALDPRERHKLGAHFTPRAYVERLVVPTVIEPLREEWDAAQAAATKREADGDDEAAREEIVQFHRRLCDVRVLDPACGSGNFLYVTLEHLKRLEAEVLSVLEDYGGQQALDMEGGYRVSPEQLMGLEVNPRAAQIADVVLWIGYLQWHFRTHGDADRLDPPLLDDIDNIQTRDAVLAYDDRHQRTDEDGTPVTMWDRRTYKEDPTTGERVPDESAQVPVYDYENPEPAAWPEADFIVGNPPFIGAKDMRDALGDGYTEAVRDAYLYKVRKSADFVMFWWYKAAKAVRGKLDGWDGAAERFGLITTNSVRQTFNRKVMEKQIKGSPPVSLVFAIPDHPWVASADGSDVRIAMTAGAVTDQPGTLQTVTREEQSKGLHWDVELDEQTGNILPDLTIGADVTGAEPLEANEDLANRGVCLFGKGFEVSLAKARELGLGEVDGLENHIRRYRNGRDLTQKSRDQMVIDLYGLEKEEVRERFPAVYQHVKEHVKPEREENNREWRRKHWWLFGEPNPKLRDMLEDLDRFIATPETAKHRFFQFLDATILPDNALVNIALDDAYHLGVLSSRLHVVWSLAAGGRLGVGNDPRYFKTQCFDPFPFPAATESQKATIRDLGAQLDAHRNERLDAHDDLTMTALYNVLKKERRGEDLDADERIIHEQGLVGVLKELHDELDAAVAAAYGWDAGLPEETILQRLVDLNAERRAEEEEGHVRYLRPEYQAPETVETQAEMDLDVQVGGDGAPAEPLDWPSGLTPRAKAVRAVMTHADAPLTVEQVAQHFYNARRDDVRELLETLAALGHVEGTDDGAYAT
ncbi:class I SAM-dependent DNA methyltransferase [Salinibacter sp.]|uniref:class I SAM-dependent DNA methyltransferase n=2 Tax=Salinibacter sp. TaxID=2065818 RepID=UPI0021E922CE|nr:DNA methyltransferase [Salinibacter sp.]